jgi:hypothetical protein
MMRVIKVHHVINIIIPTGGCRPKGGLLPRFLFLSEVPVRSLCHLLCQQRGLFFTLSSDMSFRSSVCFCATFRPRSSTFPCQEHCVFLNRRDELELPRETARVSRRPPHLLIRQYSHVCKTFEITTVSGGQQSPLRPFPRSLLSGFSHGLVRLNSNV